MSAHDDRVLEALWGVRTRLAAGWTQGAAARDARGNEVWSGGDTAERFCLIGASIRTTTEIAMRRYLSTEPSAGDGLYVATEGRLAKAAIALFPYRVLGGEYGPHEFLQAINDDPETSAADALAIVDYAIAQHTAPDDRDLLASIRAAVIAQEDQDHG